MQTADPRNAWWMLEKKKETPLYAVNSYTPERDFKKNYHPLTWYSHGP